VGAIARQGVYVWQATLVQSLLKEGSVASELVYIKSEGDLNTVTPLYDLGVQGIFTKTLDIALLNKRIDIAVHSMKDVPTKLPAGIRQAAVLERASYKDILVYKGNKAFVETTLNEQPLAIMEGQLAANQHLASESGGNNPPLLPPFTIATSSVRRRAQWLNRYPLHQVENIRGNVNTRLRKVAESNWSGAIFAAAGLERINLRPEESIDLDWMLPAPAQGAIMVVCREDDASSYEACQLLNHENTALCTGLEKEFLSVLMGGCSTPVSALAQIHDAGVFFKGNLCSTDGKTSINVNRWVARDQSTNLGKLMANELLQNPEARHIIDTIQHARN
ncbi:MAG: hydroxymethylbilane synthase, partial [Chitinophagaceae bacterium]